MCADPRVMAAVLVTLVAFAADAQSACPSGARPKGVLGIGWYHCVGGVCLQREVANDAGFEFTNEPRLRDIDPTGPSAKVLVDGDVLVAVGGEPVTTPSAGRKLANLGIGDSVRLTVRRRGILTDVAIVARAGCSDPLLAVTADTVHPALTRMRVRLPQMGTDRGAGSASGRLEHLRSRSSPGSLGFAIACDSCGWVGTEGGGRRWQAAGRVTVSAVDPQGPADAAGLVAGDVLTHIDGHAVGSRSGSDALSGVVAGSRHTLRVTRFGRAREIVVQAVPVR